MRKALWLLCIVSLVTGATACSKTVETTEAEPVEAETVLTESVEESETETKMEMDTFSETENDTESETEIVSEGTGETLPTSTEEERTVETEREPTVHGELFTLSEIDTEYVQEEADQALEIAKVTMQSLQTCDAEHTAEIFADYSDVAMQYYGAFGKIPDKETLVAALKDEFSEVSSLSPTITYTPSDVHIAKADDVFWEVMQKDSKLMSSVYNSYDYDMAEKFHIDKAYKVNFVITDTEDKEYFDTGILYVVRVNGEWKYENLFNFLYDVYYNLIEQEEGVCGMK